jgi:hypothetical protein
MQYCVTSWFFTFSYKGTLMPSLIATPLPEPIVVILSELTKLFKVTKSVQKKLRMLGMPSEADFLSATENLMRAVFKYPDVLTAGAFDENTALNHASNYGAGSPLKHLVAAASPCL